MILQALQEYYDRKAADTSSALAPQGWERKEIPFVVVLAKDGSVVQLDDLRDGAGPASRAKAQLVPASVKRSVNVASNLLWDTVEYALGVDVRGKGERVKTQHAAFRQRLLDAFGDQPSDEGLNALRLFLSRWTESQMPPSQSWTDAKERNAFISLRLQGDPYLICQRPSVRRPTRWLHPPERSHPDASRRSRTRRG